jgi:16S rRNA (guanine527-N7)-methyltransferase
MPNSSTKAGIPPRLEAELSSLRQLANSHNLAFDDIQLEKMVGFVELLLKWNRSFNLISRGDQDRIVSRHIAESIGLLVVVAPSRSCSMMDVGSGGGFPAVPIKILRPDLRMTLVESNGKKASFLKNVGMKLSLQDYWVLDKRIENLSHDEIPAQLLVTARAVADLTTLWKSTSKFIFSGGMLLSIKGEDREEIDLASQAHDVSEISTIAFPDWLNIEKSRFVISITKSQNAQTMER